jgi:hypothetical protein
MSTRPKSNGTPKGKRSPEPAPQPAKWGTLRRIFSQQEKEEFVRLVESGMGRIMACRHMKVDPKTVKRMLDEDPDFAAVLRSVERAKEETAEAVIYSEVLAGSVHAYRLYLDHRARVRARWAENAAAAEREKRIQAALDRCAIEPSETISPHIKPECREAAIADVLRRFGGAPAGTAADGRAD